MLLFRNGSLSALAAQVDSRPMEHKFKQGVAVFFGIVALSALAACNSRPEVITPPQMAPAESATSRAVSVSGIEYAFIVSSRTISAGQVEFLFSNDGAWPHAMAIVPVDGDHFGLPIGDAPVLAPGESVVLRAELPEGKYAFVCLVLSPDDVSPQSHMELGMIRTFKVGS